MPDDDPLLGLRRLRGQLAARADAFGLDIGRATGLAGIYRRVVRRLLRWYTAPQADYNRALADTLDDLVTLAERQGLRIDQLEQALAQAHPDHPASRRDWSDLAHLPIPGLDTLPDALAAWLPDPATAEPGPLLTLGASPALLRDLRQRGHTLRPILPQTHWADAAHDDGVDVLRAQPLEALAQPEQRGLPAGLLDRLPNQLPTAELRTLLGGIARALADGAPLIAVALDPNDPDARALAAADPAHQRLLAPDLLRALGEASGLTYVDQLPIAPRYAVRWRRI